MEYEGHLYLSFGSSRLFRFLRYPRGEFAEPAENKAAERTATRGESGCGAQTAAGASAAAGRI